jgi:diaminopimelate decarboxylase
MPRPIPTSPPACAATSSASPTPRRWRAYRRAAQLPGIEVVGIDCHIGSQITESSPYVEALDRLLDLIETLEAEGIAIPHLDLGGGLGIVYDAKRRPMPKT